MYMSIRSYANKSGKASMISLVLESHLKHHAAGTQLLPPLGLSSGRLTIIPMLI